MKRREFIMLLGVLPLDKTQPRELDAPLPSGSHERNLERYKIISRLPPSCTTKQQIRRRLSSQRPSVVTMAAKNKCLAQMNKSGTAGKATKKTSNPASRVDPMGADHRVVPAIKQAL